MTAYLNCRNLYPCEVPRLAERNGLKLAKDSQMENCKVIDEMTSDVENMSLWKLDAPDGELRFESGTKLVYTEHDHVIGSYRVVRYETEYVNVVTLVYYGI